jgi:hypothetical protein
MDNKPVQTADATNQQALSRTLSLEQLLLLVRSYSLPEQSLQVRYEPLEPSLNVSSTRQVRFSLGQSMQPVMLSTPPLGLPYLPFKDLPQVLPSQKQNDKQQCNNAVMLEEVLVEQDMKVLDSQQSPQKMRCDDVVTPIDQFESQE